MEIPRNRNVAGAVPEVKDAIPVGETKEVPVQPETRSGEDVPEPPAVDGEGAQEVSE